jgi:hypothetical protein
VKVITIFEIELRFIFILNYIDIATLANQYQTELLTADDGAKYDRIIDINLSEVNEKFFFLILKISLA